METDAKSASLGALICWDSGLARPAGHGMTESFQLFHKNLPNLNLTFDRSTFSPSSQIRLAVVLECALLEGACGREQRS